MRAYSRATLLVLCLSLVGAQLAAGVPRPEEEEERSFDHENHESHEQQGEQHKEHQHEEFKQHEEQAEHHQHQEQGKGPMGELMGHMSHGLSNFMGGGHHKGSPLAPLANLIGSSGVASHLAGGTGTVAALPAPVAMIAKPLAEAVQKGAGLPVEKKEGAGPPPTGLMMDDLARQALEPVKSITELTKLFLNPAELVKHISSHFQLPLHKLIERIGSGYVIGIEALLQPLMACVRIVERVFQPDCGRLKFICKMGNQLHFVQQHLLKFSPSFIESSSHMKAFHEGFGGKDCELIHSDCSGSGLRLKKPFEELKGLKDPKSEQAAIKVIEGDKPMAKN